MTRLPGRWFVVLALAALAAGCAFAQPPPRAYTDMAYDSQSEVFVLFGGQTGDFRDPSQFAGDTWVFDPATGVWEQRTPEAAPPAGVGFNLAYDEQSDRVVLWGGGSAYLEPQVDVWSYDTDADVWTKVETTSSASPGGRIGSVMVYDSESDRLVMFGGFSPQQSLLLRDTWSFDLDTGTWTHHEADPSPSARNFHQMAYDPATDRVYLWGGDSKSLRDRGAMWSFDVDEGTWTMFDRVSDPDPHYYGGMAYLPAAEQLVFYGGGTNGSGETWLFDPSAGTWTQVEASGPGSRSRFAMAGGTSGALLFGGQLGPTQYEYENDTWWFGSEALQWSQP